MKLFNYIAIILSVTTIISCRDVEDNTNPGTDNADYFKTQSEAIQKGKNDLLAILRSGSDFQFTIDPELLQKSQQGITVKHKEVDFDRLLKEGNPLPLEQLTQDSKSNINTLVVDHNVVTVIQTANSEKGWTVTGLADAALTNDLDEVLSTQASDRIEAVTLYEIANLQAYVYQVKTLDGEAYFLKYDGFTLKQATSIEEIYPVLHGDAQALDRKYGNEIKLKKLVK